MNRAAWKIATVKITAVLTILSGFVGVESVQAGIIPWAYDVIFGPVGSLQRGYYRGAAYGGGPMGGYAGYSPMAVSYAAYPMASSAGCSRCGRNRYNAPSPYFAGYATSFGSGCCANTGCGCGPVGGCASGNCGTNCTTNAAPADPVNGPIKALPDNPPLHKPATSGTFDDKEPYVSPKTEPKVPSNRPRPAAPADGFLPPENRNPVLPSRKNEPADPKAKPLVPPDDSDQSGFKVNRPDLDASLDKPKEKTAIPTEATPVDEGRDPRNQPRGMNLDTRVTWSSAATPERMAMKARFTTPSIVKSEAKPNADWTPLPKSETQLAAQK